MRLRLLLPLLLSSLVALASPLSAADPATPIPCNRTLTPCIASEGWLITERHWAPGSAIRDIVGGRLQSEIRYRYWRIAGRVDATGLPGEYQDGKLETVRTVEVHAAGAYDILLLPGDLSLGVAVGVGAAVGLDDVDGARAWTPKAFTGGAGIRVSSPQGWAYLVVGQHQALRGLAGVAVWQMRVSDRVANVGTFAIGSKTWTATTGMAVRFK